MTALRVVQVGVGLYGRGWAELVARRPGCRLAAVVDARRGAREWAAADLGVPVFARLARALAAVEADAVVLVSPPATHRPLAEEALAAGRHVLVEKPLAPSMEDARAIAAAAAGHGLHVVVAQNYRFRRQARALRRLVRSGVLGRLLGIRIECRRDLRRAWVSPRDWRGRMPDPFLLDMAIHHVDLARSITGREVRACDARAWRAPDGPFRHEVDVCAHLDLDDGVPVGYAGSWAAPFRQTSWNGDWELVGERGRATWTGGVDDALRGTVRLQRFGGPVERVALPALPAVDRAALLEELRRAAFDGVAPETSAADNLRTLAVVLALARSAQERRPVEVAEVLG